MNLLAGSTGFLGNNILKALGFNKSPTIALGRRPVSNLPDDAEELIIDFDNLEGLRLSDIDHVYLSMGYPLIYFNDMGLMSASLKKDFFLVDFTYQLAIAKKAKEAGAKNISLISAVAADSNSWNYYLKTKGLLEEEIIKLGFESTNIFQPGHLTGNKFRLDILLADVVSLIFDPFLFGPLKKFRSISAEKLSVAGSIFDKAITSVVAIASVVAVIIPAAELTLLSLTEVVGGIFWVWLPIFGINEVPSTNTETMTDAQSTVKAKAIAFPFLEGSIDPHPFSGLLLSFGCQL